MSKNLNFALFQLEPYMDEDFLKHALSQMGEENVISIKVREVGNRHLIPNFSCNFFSYVGHQEQVHGRAGLVRLHQLRLGPRGPHGNAQTERKDHTKQHTGESVPLASEPVVVVSSIGKLA